MPAQVTGLCEGSRTDIALIRSRPGVNTDVLRQGRTVRKRTSTAHADVRSESVVSADVR